MTEYEFTLPDGTTRFEMCDGPGDVHTFMRMHGATKAVSVARGDGLTLLAITGELDDQDRARALLCMQARAGSATPMVGDIILIEGEPPVRITHEWGERHAPRERCEYQTTPRLSDAIQHHGFFLYGHGVASYSGTLDPPLSGTDLEPTDETRQAVFWFFRHGEARAHNGVYWSAPVRCWRYTGTSKPWRTEPISF